MEKQAISRPHAADALTSLILALTLFFMATALAAPVAHAQRAHITFLRPSDLVIQADKAMAAGNHERAAAKSERALNTPLSRSDERRALQILCVSVSTLHNVTAPLTACARDERTNRIDWVRANSKAQKLERKDRMEAAIAAYREGLEIAPENPVLEANLARALTRQSSAQASDKR